MANLAGRIASDRGSIRLDVRDVARLVARQRARRGLVRSFRITRLSTSLSVLDGLAFAAQARQARRLLCRRADCAVLLIERDADAPFHLADRVLMLVNGGHRRQRHRRVDATAPLRTLPVPG